MAETGFGSYFHLRDRASNPVLPPADVTVRNSKMTGNSMSDMSNNASVFFELSAT